MKGELPLLAEVQRTTEELMSGAGAGAGSDSGPWAAETAQAEGVRKLGLLLAGAAFQKYREALEKEQEILAGLADLISITYLLQSAILRARKHGGAAAPVMAAMDRAEAIAHLLLPRLAEGDALRAQAAMARRLLKRELSDTIAVRREIARAVLEAGRYPLG
jgi:hypothetical protein